MIDRCKNQTKTGQASNVFINTIKTSASRPARPHLSGETKY
ncbi:unnamed protein product [Acanthoscelides obtectus]|uniref:Uncharacterized protein n=1 Tax=Acanthoscelides obtectus TaxID=200917 RepID=A0A9P0LMH5_ACAOB|nr:unnamed protein product [Acanthoscelides obtectus]CAK1678401.1 hypothetical protein AOBTE_LOCUS31871 [Acanthoscelides obtectus]